MSLSAPDRRKIPRLAAGVDLRTLPLSSVDGYLLSRVDGTLGADELAVAVGMSEERVNDTLEKLAMLGAIEWGLEPERPTNRPARPSGSPTAPPQRPASNPRMRIREESGDPRDRSKPTTASGSPAANTMPAPAPPVDPFTEDVEIDAPRRKEIVDLFNRLANIDYYRLLGVPRAADRKEIRDAYFRLSKQFHPDSLFRKRLGSFKPRMEAIFNELTEAYETLGKQKPRAEYDAYLKLNDITQEVEQTLASGGASAERVLEDPNLGLTMPPPEGHPSTTMPSMKAPAVSDRASGPATGTRTIPPIPAIPPPPIIETPSAPPKGSSNPAGTPSGPPSSTFARPLGGGGPPSMPPARVSRIPSAPPASPPAAATNPVPPNPTPSGGAASIPGTGTHSNPSTGAHKGPGTGTHQGLTDEDRRRRMNELMGHRLKGAGIKMPEPVAQVPFVRPSERARQLVQNLKQVANVTGGKDPVARHLARARSAELQQDLVGALNSLRMAMAIAADRPEVISEHDRVKLMLAKNMAGKYEEQARYEESKEKWGAAAISWAKVFEGRPEDGDAALKAADYLIRANGDLHTARTLAQTAVRLKPSATAHRVLGEVFLAANLRLNAKREFETALKLDPKDEIVKNHLSRLRDVEKT